MSPAAARTVRMAAVGLLTLAVGRSPRAHGARA
jgi:hypothetical protein